MVKLHGMGKWDMVIHHIMGIVMMIPIYVDKYHGILVGGFNPSEKILVSWDDYSQYMQK